jgi:hypothetical protein
LPYFFLPIQAAKAAGFLAHFLANLPLSFLNREPSPIFAIA